MTITTTPHLNFRNQARAALEHYRSAFGGTLTVVTYADLGAVTDPAEADQVMWGQVEAPSGFRIMAFDVPAARPHDPGTDAAYVSVRGTDADELTAAWATLAEGATIRQDLGPAPWAPLYGMLDDQFGVTWVVDVAV